MKGTSRTHVTDYFILALLAAVVFGRMAGHDFQTSWDDNWNILYNEGALGFSWTNLRTAFTSYVIGAYVPIQTLSFMLDYTLWGVNPAGFHVTSIFLHTVNGFLVYRLFFRWYGDRLLCLVGAALFLVHPVQAETVGWISDRKTILAMLFFLLAWEGYCRYREAESTSARWRAYTATLALFSLSLLSKSISVVLPAVLVLYDLCFFSGVKVLRLKDKVPFVAVAGAVAAVTLYGFSAPDGARVPYHGGSLAATAYSMLPVFARYLGSIVWPSHLSALYAPTLHRSPDPAVVGSLLLLVTVTVSGAWLFRRDRRLGFWVAFFFACLFPVSQLVPTLTMMADRYLYFPMMAVAALAGSGAAFLRGRAQERHRPLLYCLLVVPLLVLAATSFGRAAVWRDSLALWHDAAAKEPGSDKAWGNLGEALMVSGKAREAREAYERGLRLNPDNTEILDGLGSLYTEAGELDRGEALLKRLLGLKPSYVTGWASLGTNYVKRGDFPAAEAAYGRARELQPEAMQVVMLLGDLERLRGRLERSRAYYLEADGKGWSQPDTAYRLACVEAMAGNSEESIAWIEKALERGFGDFRTLEEDGQLAAVRKDPRFAELLRRYAPEQGK